MCKKPEEEMGHTVASTPGLSYLPCVELVQKTHMEDEKRLEALACRVLSIMQRSSQWGAYGTCL